MRQRDAEQVTVAVPSWRNDVAAPIMLDQSPTLDPAKAAKAAEGCAAIEAENDLIEEVLRLRGLDAVPAVSLPRESPVPPATLTPRQQRTAVARRTLAAAGLMECVTFSFMARAEAERFGATPDALRLSNPIAADLDQLRPTPLATLALAAKRNAARGYSDVALFEIGPAFAVDAPDGQKLVAAGLRAGQTPRNWLAPQRPVDVDGCQGRSVGVADRGRRAAGGAAGHHRCADVPASRPLRPGAAGAEDRDGVFRRDPSAAAGGARPAGADGGVRAEPRRRRRSEAAQEGRARPAGVPAGAARFRVHRGQRGRRRQRVCAAAKGAERALITGVSLFDVYEGDRMPRARSRSASRSRSSRANAP